MKCLISLLLLASISSGAIALVGTPPTPVGVSSGDATTGDYDTTGATLIVVYVATATVSASAATVSDNKTACASWTALSNATSTGGTAQGAFFYCKNPASVGSAHKFTANSGSYATISVAAYSGADTSSPFDQENTGFMDLSAPCVPGSVTPGQNNELVITGFSTFSGGGTLSVSGNSVTLIVQLGSGSFEGNGIGHVIQTTATTVNAISWTDSNGDTLAACNVATFKVAAAAGFHGPNGGVFVTGP